MPGNIKDILSNLSTEIDQETLLLYLQGKLAPEKQNEIEQQLAADSFNSEAAEGLEEFENREKLLFMVEMLNRDLKKKTEIKKKRRDKLRIKYQPWIYISILILLLLIILCYIAIHSYLKARS